LPSETEYALAEIGKQLTRIANSLEILQDHADVNADEIAKMINRVRFGLESR